MYNITHTPINYNFLLYFYSEVFMITGIKGFYINNSKRFTAVIAILDYFILALYGLFVVEAFLRSTTLNINWNPYYHFSLKIILILLVLGKSLLKWVNNPGIYIILGFCAVGFALAYIKGNYGILLELILFTIAFVDIDFKKLLSIFAATIGTGVIIISISSMLGILNNLTYTSGGRLRMALGINYPTDFAAYIMYFCLVWIFLRKDKISYPEIVLMYGLGAVVYKVSYARNSTICILLLATSVLLIKLVKNIPRWISFSAALAFPVCTAISLGLSRFYSPDNHIMAELDSLLSSRLSLGKGIFDYYPLKLFGQHIDMVGNGGYSLSGLNHYSNGNSGYNFIDSSYLSVLFRFGIFVFMCTIILFTLTGFIARKNKDYSGLLVIVIIALHSTVEHHLLDLNYNPFIFLLISSFYGNKAVYPVKSDIPESSLEDKGSGKKRLILPIIVVYGILSVLLFVMNKKEPAREVFPIAFPEAGTDTGEGKNSPDASEGNVPSLYTPCISTGDYYIQIIYTPKTISGIELWFDADNVMAGDTSIYNISFSRPEGRLLGSIDLSVSDMKKNEYTRLIFDGFFLEEGEQYSMTLTNITEASSPVRLGLVPNLSPWNGGLYNADGYIPDNIMCFNLIYDYHNWGYINWIVLTIMLVLSIRLCAFSPR